MLPDTEDAERRAAKLERIAQVLIDRVDRLEETRGSAWSMFQAAVALEQEALARTRIAAVGPLVARAVEEAGGHVAMQPGENFHVKPMVGEIVAAIG